jgi:hypothetical protein
MMNKSVILEIVRDAVARYGDPNSPEFDADFLHTLEGVLPVVELLPGGIASEQLAAKDSTRH